MSNRGAASGRQDTAMRRLARLAIPVATCLAMIAVGTGCTAPSPRPTRGSGGGERLPSTLSTIAAPNGRYEIALAHPAYSVEGKSVGYEGADLALRFSDRGVTLVAYAFDDPDISIDQVSAFRRERLRAAKEDRFVGEERFFLPSGRHRPAALLRWEGLAGSSTATYVALVADTDSGPIEVVAWTYEADADDAGELTVDALRLVED